MVDGDSALARLSPRDVACVPELPNRNAVYVVQPILEQDSRDEEPIEIVPQPDDVITHAADVRLIAPFTDSDDEPKDLSMMSSTPASPCRTRTT